MRVFSLIILIGWCYIPSFADVLEQSQIQWPRYILESFNSDSLATFLSSDSEIDRIAACIRIGELGEKKYYPTLLATLEREPYRTGLDLHYGVKYHSLIAMAKAGEADAEETIKRIAARHLIKRNDVDRQVTSDTILVLQGAFDALGLIASEDAKEFLDSVFKDNSVYWPIRSMANYNYWKIGVADTSISSKADTANFLFSHLDDFRGPNQQFESDGSINAVFLNENNIRTIIYENRGWIIPYLNDYVNSISIDDPYRHSILGLKTDMERNPAE